MSSNILRAVGPNAAKDTALENPFFSGDAGSVTESDLPEYGIVEAEEVTIGSNSTVEISNMLSVFATNKITIESGAKIDGNGNCDLTEGVYGQNGVNTHEWIEEAYTSCLCSKKLAIRVDYTSVMAGGGKNVDNAGGAALLLAAPEIEIQAPTTIDLHGEGSYNDGHFGIIYSDELVYDGRVDTDAKQTVLHPNTNVPERLQGV